MNWLKRRVISSIITDLLREVTSIMEVRAEHELSVGLYATNTTPPVQRISVAARCPEPKITRLLIPVASREFCWITDKPAYLDLAVSDIIMYENSYNWPDNYGRLQGLKYIVNDSPDELTGLDEVDHDFKF